MREREKERESSFMHLFWGLLLDSSVVSWHCQRHGGGVLGFDGYTYTHLHGNY